MFQKQLEWQIDLVTLKFKIFVYISSFYNTDTKTLYLENVFVGNVLMKNKSAIIDLQSGIYKILN
jgi:hypothetical protein